MRFIFIIWMHLQEKVGNKVSITYVSFLMSKVQFNMQVYLDNTFLKRPVFVTRGADEQFRIYLKANNNSAGNFL